MAYRLRVTTPKPVTAPKPVSEYVQINANSVIRITTPPVIFKETFWTVPAPKDDIIKPHSSSDFFWPAKRAQNLVKAHSPETKRQSFNDNIRYLALRAQMPPEVLIKTNPVVIGRRLGVTDAKMSQIFSNWDKLRQGYNCPSGSY